MRVMVVMDVQMVNMRQKANCARPSEQDSAALRRLVQ